MLIFPTAVLALERDWNTPYSQLLGLSLGLSLIHISEPTRH